MILHLKFISIHTINRFLRAKEGRINLGGVIFEGTLKKHLVADCMFFRDQSTVRGVQRSHGEHRELRGLRGDGPQAYAHGHGGGEVSCTAGKSMLVDITHFQICLSFSIHLLA